MAEGDSSRMVTQHMPACRECGLPLTEGDLYCGNCGAKRPGGEPEASQARPSMPREAWPTADPRAQPGAGRGRPAPATHSALSSRFFAHAVRRATGLASNPTRYLCAAAYLNPDYANRVIGELVASHRAVAPSVDMDLGPVIRHCLQARKIALVRDAVLAFLLVAGLLLALLPTIVVLVIALGLGFLRGPSWQRRSAGAKIAGVAIVGFVLVGVAGLVVIILVIRAVGHIFSSGPAGVAVGTGGSSASAILSFLLPVIVFLALIATTVIIHTYVKYRTLSEHLRPGAPPMQFSPSGPDVESRIAQVEAAQWGNVTLYSGENPFIGTGRVNRAWSIAIELRERPPARDLVARQLPPRRYVPLDPVELQRIIRQRLLKLNDPGLPENERISALTVEDHVVGEGLRRWDGPLIDPDQRIPYSQAGNEAVLALVHHPQAGLRYYQRVSVNDRGQAVFSNGQEVIAGADQEVAVSAFIYVAVEGRMLYVEFVTTVLPPIQRPYHIIDRLPTTSSGAFLAKVIHEAATSMFADLIGAIPGLIRSLLVMRRERKAFAEEADSYDDYLFGDVGVQMSTRELGSARSPHTYIQDLDVTKYTKIIERLLNDTVLEFLYSKGVDTSAYASSANTIVNGNVVSVGTNNGSFAVGDFATVSSPSPGSAAASPPSATGTG